MAATNISNIDGADAVANVAAGGETVLKSAVTEAITRVAQEDKRVVELFFGQMSAEGFALTAPGLLYYIQSPTVKVEVWAQASGQKLIKVLYSGVQIAQFPLSIF